MADWNRFSRTKYLLKYPPCGYLLDVPDLLVDIRPVRRLVEGADVVSRNPQCCWNKQRLLYCGQCVFKWHSDQYSYSHRTPCKAIPHWGMHWRGGTWSRVRIQWAGMLRNISHTWARELQQATARSSFHSFLWTQSTRTTHLTPSIAHHCHISGVTFRFLVSCLQGTDHSWEVCP